MFATPDRRLALVALVVLCGGLLAVGARAQTSLALVTPLDGNVRRESITFVITAKQDVTIESFDLLLRGKSSPFRIDVIEDKGIFGTGPVQSVTVTAVDSTTPTPLNLNLGIQLKASEKRSFVIDSTFLSQTQETCGIIVRKVISASTPATPYASDGFIDVGIGTVNFGISDVTTYNFNGVVRYSIDSLAIVDTAVIDITAPIDSDPNSCVPLGATEAITFKLGNDSLATIAAGTPIQADWTVTDEGGGVQTGSETFNLASPMAPFGVETFTFGTFADLSDIGTFNVCVNALTPGDGFSANNFFKTDVLSGGGAPIPAGLSDVVSFFDVVEVEGSKDLPVGMVNDQNDAQNGSGSAFENEWVVHSSSPLPGGPLFSFDANGGFATINDSGEYDAVNMLTRCYDVTGTSDVFLRFFVYSNNVDPGGPNVNENQLHVDVITNNGGVLMDVIPPIGHKGDSWCPVHIDLSTYNDVVQVRFRASTNNGGVSHNIAIDEISVQERYSIDLAVEGGGPSDTNACGGGARCVNLIVVNQGLQTLPAGTMVTGSYSINGGAPVFETFVLQVDTPPGHGEQFFFMQLASILPGSNAVAVTATVFGDIEPANDTFLTTATGRRGGTKAPFLETFDQLQPGSFVLPLGWEQDFPVGISSGNWRVESKATPQPAPPSDHTEPGGIHAFNRDGADSSGVILMTPCIDVSCLNEPYLSFYFYAVSDAADGFTAAPGRTLHVDLVTYPGPNITLDITSPITATGRTWFRRSVALMPDTGDIRVRFRVEDSNGDFSRVSFSVDDVSITEKPALGTPDDFSQRILVNDTGKKSGEEFYQEALGGDTVTMVLDSPQGGLVGGVPILLAEVFPDGNPPPQDGLFPGLHFSTNVQVVYDGHANPTPFGPPVLVAGGMTFNFTVPPGLDPFTVRSQWIVATQNASNNIFAAGAGQDLDIDR